MVGPSSIFYGSVGHVTSPKSRERILIPRAPGNELDFNTGNFSLVLYVLLYGFNTMDSIQIKNGQLSC